MITKNNTKLIEQPNRELHADELHDDELNKVAGGRKAGGDQATSGKTFLQFRFQTVFTT
jgi:hypothetical protein